MMFFYITPWRQELGATPLLYISILIFAPTWGIYFGLQIHNFFYDFDEDNMYNNVHYICKGTVTILYYDRVHAWSQRKKTYEREDFSRDNKKTHTQDGILNHYAHRYHRHVVEENIQFREKWQGIKTDDTMFLSTYSIIGLFLFHFLTSRAPSGWTRHGAVPDGHRGHDDHQNLCQGPLCPGYPAVFYHGSTRG